MSARTDYLAYLTAHSMTAIRAVTFEEASGTPVEHYTGVPLMVGGSPTWHVNSGYTAGKCPTINDYWGIPSAYAWMGPYSKVTVLLIRAKLDLTLRDSAAFGVYEGDFLSTHLPWSNGTVYFDYGPFSTSRLTWTGWVPTLGIEAWGFRGGPSGQSIWHAAFADSVATKVQSTSTVPAGGGNTTNPFLINQRFAMTGDVQDFFFLAIVIDEVPDSVLATFTPHNVLDATVVVPPTSTLILPKIVYPAASSTSFQFRLPGTNVVYPHSLHAVRHDNISAHGNRETIYERTDRFLEFDIEYSQLGTDLTNWKAFMLYALQGGPFDYYPNSATSDYVTYVLEDTNWVPAYKALKFYSFHVKFRKYAGWPIIAR